MYSNSINKEDEVNFVIEESTKIIDIIKHPKFRGFGQFIFPTTDRNPNANTTVNNIDYLLPYHSNINTETTIKVTNYMIHSVNNNQTIFYHLYSEKEKRLDISKQDTGLFFFRGKPNAPFAIVIAGGGFSYVGSIHEGFPHALEISQKGYNVFVLQYRTNSARKACKDLARAISFIFKNKDILNVSTSNYSLWGGSAGARVAAYLGSYGTRAFKEDNLPKPAVVVMQYTGHFEYSDIEPATFAIVGENDWIVDWRVMEARINKLKENGVETEFHLYPNLGHGFGLGIDTSAKGWIGDAINFWDKQIK